jgi:hypothetical protein
MAITLSPKDLARYQADAKRLIAKFDSNNDGVLDATEIKKFDGRDSWTTSTRIGSSDFVSRTTVYYDKYRGIKEDEFRNADANKDNKLTDQEIFDAFADKTDRNKDGKFGFFEKLGKSVEGQFSKSWQVETDRKTRVEYDPLPRDYNRPTPPSSGGYDRPTPPSSGGYDRPTPPSSGSDRPTPPSSGSDRPTPPGL